jgi:hypothetical protein
VLRPNAVLVGSVGIRRNAHHRYCRLAENIWKAVMPSSGSVHDTTKQ